MISIFLTIFSALLCGLGIWVVAPKGNGYGEKPTKGNPIGWALVLFGAVAVIGSAVSFPYVNVWQQGLSGEAELARAEQNRQIVVNEAMAKQEAAKYWAQAEIERAKGVAEANKIIANGLGGPEGYLRYLYIDGLQEANRNGSQVIYIPTEAGLPILEAGKRDQ